MISPGLFCLKTKNVTVMDKYNFMCWELSLYNEIKHIIHK